MWKKNYWDVSVEGLFLGCDSFFGSLPNVIDISSLFIEVAEEALNAFGAVIQN